MENLNYTFEIAEKTYSFGLTFIAGTGAESHFLFGSSHEKQPIAVADFYIATHLTSQALWSFVMGEEFNRSLNRGDNLPVEHVSWNDISNPDGFLEKLNQSFENKCRFRLPTEAEWEYAARGGRHWREDFMFAGTNDLGEAGWYEGNSGPYTDLKTIHQMGNSEKLTRTHSIGQKKPGKLGLYDMNGNVWEWCEDWFCDDVRFIPGNGTAYTKDTGSKVLRGGCHHNWAEHCTNTKRYCIEPGFYDGCIGFRLAMDAEI